MADNTDANPSAPLGAPPALVPPADDNDGTTGPADLENEPPAFDPLLLPPAPDEGLKSSAFVLLNPLPLAAPVAARLALESMDLVSLGIDPTSSKSAPTEHDEAAAD